MMDEPELTELLKTLNEEYDEVTIEILGKCADREDYTDEFISQNKIFAQIELVQHILASGNESLLVKQAAYN